MRAKALFLFLSLALSVFASEPYKEGDSFTRFSSRDQFEKPFDFDPSAHRLLVVSYEMGVGKDTNAWLAKQAPGFLAEKKAVFLADIFPMPGIGRVFALPKMKKYPHQIVLGDEEKLLERHPRKKGHLTVFVFDGQGSIREIRFVDPEKEIAKAFGP